MKLLFDGNISFRIVEMVKSQFPGASQVRQHSLESSSDLVVWNFATQNNLCIVTKDSDFNDLAIAKGFPPKVLWIKTGNCTTDAIAQLLISHHETIESFLKDDHASTLILK